MDASTELLRAVFDRLKATAAITALVGQHIYDRAPADQSGNRVDVPYPYITAGPTTAIPADFDCLDGEEITIQLDVWSSGALDASTSAQCRKISDLVKRALHDVDLTLTENALVTLQWELTRILDDRNPTIRHGAIQFTATIETP